MSHIEDEVSWRRVTSDPTSDGYAMGLAQLATVTGLNVGANGARLSVQFGRNYLDRNAGANAYPGGPTSLRWVLENGGNFWNHTHDGSFTNLVSNWTTVASAYAAEANPVVAFSVASQMTAGRSGGADINAPTLDWVSISVAAGINRMNSSAVNNYACTPESLRPYQMSKPDIVDGVFYHDAAPGPLYDGAPTTMRQRPFWVNSASQWDAKLTSTLPQEATVGSLLMIPHPSRLALRRMADGRAAGTSSVDTITQDDLDAAFTEVWSTYRQMELYQGSISNVWYVHINPGQIAHQASGSIYPVVASLGAWVQSINHLLNVPNSAVWMNMNEITSSFANPTSAFW